MATSTNAELLAALRQTQPLPRQTRRRRRRRAGRPAPRRRQPARRHRPAGRPREELRRHHERRHDLQEQGQLTVTPSPFGRAIFGSSERLPAHTILLFQKSPSLSHLLSQLAWKTRVFAHACVPKILEFTPHGFQKSSSKNRPAGGWELVVSRSLASGRVQRNARFRGNNFPQQ